MADLQFITTLIELNSGLDLWHVITNISSRRKNPFSSRRIVPRSGTLTSRLFICTFTGYLGRLEKSTARNTNKAPSNAKGEFGKPLSRVHE
ncbi:hypothetical protein L596_003660 [Steinernema carpocapsae]|uniref:Uncharacterized protein n=1 Tax=Steinernema carpocapsae TaxID=34508 RepID=A0A4V6I823_STECR|nr:hypothetical protein L596_003660 [Steinernema carpocapsae]